MKSESVLAVALVLPLFVSVPVQAQLTAANDGPIVYGHHHVNATDASVHNRFWVDTLGGVIVKVGTASREIVKFPNVLVFVSERATGGGTKGTTVDHIGFQVPNLRAMVDKVKAAGYPIVTRAELPPALDVVDDLAFIADQNTSVAFTMGPDDAKVEFIENKGMSGSIALHHIHFASPDVDAMQAWYEKIFGAKAGMRGSFQAGDLPGVNLTYSPAANPVVATQGRTLDHIGFEVKGLANFCQQLEAMGITLDRPYREVESLGVAVAFLTDPWGTYIELTEGLAKIE